MTYKSPMKIKGVTLYFETDDYEKHLDFLMCTQIAVNLFDGEKNPLNYNIYFPVFLAEIARLLLAAEDAVKIMEFCKEVEKEFYLKLHVDVSEMMGKKSSWFKGSQDIRKDIKDRIEAIENGLKNPN